MSIFCTNCGNAHKKGVTPLHFCGKCGTPLQNGTETQMKSGNQNSSVANKSKMNTQSEPQYHISVNCHICKAHFNDADEYEKHISIEYKKDPGKTWLECDFCDTFDHKPAKNSTTFISHITTHLDGGGLYKCEFQYPGKKYKCGNSFNTKRKMKNHWNNQHNISPKSSHSQKVEVDVKLNSNTNSNNDNSNSNSHLNRIPKHSNQINTNTNTDNTNNNNVKEHNNGTHMNRDSKSMDNVKDTGYRKKYVDDNGDRDRGRNKWRDKDTNTRSRTRSRSRSRGRSKRHRSYSHRDRKKDRHYRSRSISRDRNRNRNRNRNRRSHSRSKSIISDERSINQNNNNRNSNTNNNTTTNVQRQTHYRHKGTVKWFHADKKYGMIEYDNNEEIFVYYTDINKYQQILTKGEQVEFEVGCDERKKNKKKAVNVTGVDGAFVGCDSRNNINRKDDRNKDIDRDRNRDRNIDRNRNRDRDRGRDRGRDRNYASRSHSSDRHKDTKDKRDKNNDKNIWNGEIVKNYECDKPFNFSLFRIDKTDIALDIQLNEKIPKNLTINGWMNVEKISYGIVNDAYRNAEDKSTIVLTGKCENDKYKENYKEFIKNARERKKKPAAVIDMKHDHKLRIILIPTFNDRDKNMFDVDTKLEKLWKCELPKTDDLWALLTLYK